jgi:hypothetical protein
MDVFVLTREVDHEGESPLGVYASLDVAKQAGDHEANRLGWKPNEWLFSNNQWERDNDYWECLIIRQQPVIEVL